MSDFVKFRDAIKKQFDKMAASGPLFITLVDKDVVWDTYINSFPEGSNPMFRERTEHDCVACKQYIRRLGRVVGEINGKRTTIWDFKFDGFYDVVRQKMKELIEGVEICSAYASKESVIGHLHNFEIKPGAEPIKWEHFHQVLPKSVVMTGCAEYMGSSQTHKSVLKRSLEEISTDAVETVMELISQNSIYRGQEHLSTVKLIKQMKNELEKSSDKEYYLWKKSLELKGMSSLRNTVIGTLLVDISTGTELESAVKSFESKVAPHNYKRTTALVTSKMKENAKAKAQELGIEPSLHRRFASTEDISVNNVLFADNTVQEFMMDSVFDAVPTKKTAIAQSFDKVQEIGIEAFIKDVLPNAQGLELFVENKHTPNFMSLIAPVNASAPCIMKWGNNFSWTYNGDITDSAITQQVKSAGGVVDAPLRFSLSWGNRDDLDLHLVNKSRSSRERLYFAARRNFGCELDVDMRGEQCPQVENIFCKNIKNMEDGKYELMVHHFGTGWRDVYHKEERKDGFEIEVKYNDSINTLSFPAATISNKYYSILTFSVSKGVVTFDNLKSAQSSNDVWGVQTGQFCKVDMAMLSPNFWDGKEIGNKHYFFVLDKCKNPDDATGFYNEFLIDELREHRKVFELLGSNLKAKNVDTQLSGLGFSSTKPAEVLIKVIGKVNRVLKVKF